VRSAPPPAPDQALCSRGFGTKLVAGRAHARVPVRAWDLHDPHGRATEAKARTARRTTQVLPRRSPHRLLLYNRWSPERLVL